jgi:hypothetical protein
MLNRCVTLVACGLALALSSPAGTQERPPSNGDELRKLDTAFEFFRERNARDYVISTPNGIDEAKYLKVGGIEQWITIRGEDRVNPVVLVLHGGPGDATNPYGYAVFRAWLKTYTVVQWDQLHRQMLGFALSAPGYTIRDVDDWFDGQNLSGERLVTQ